MTDMLEFSDKDVKPSIIKMLQQEIMNTIETNEKNKKSQIVYTSTAGQEKELAENYYLPHCSY